MGDVGGAREVGRVEQLRGTKRIADVHVAVADGEDLVLAVDVGDLVDEAVVLRALEDVEGLLARDVVAAVRLDDVVRHVANGDAPVVEVIAAALAHALATHAAAAGAGGVFAIVLVEPVLDVLDGDGLVLMLDGALDGNNVHADARASGRHERCRAGERALRGLLEELGENRVLLELAPAHVEELRRSRHEHGENPLLLMLGILPVVFEEAHVGDLVEHGFELLRRDARRLDGGLERVGLAHLELDEHVSLLVSRSLGEAPVLIGQKLVFSEEAVRAVLAEGHDAGARVLRKLGDELGSDVRLGVGDAGAVNDHGHSSGLGRKGRIWETDGRVRAGVRAQAYGWTWACAEAGSRACASRMARGGRGG